MSKTKTKTKTQKLFVKSQPKLDKGEDFGYLSTGIHLAAGSASGHNVCASASAGCLTVCLTFAGHGQFTKTQEARNTKTQRFFADRVGFMHDAVRETLAFIRRCAKLGLLPAIRLNLTSDVRWEYIPVTRGGQWFANIFHAFPEVQFYDYTKHQNRKRDGFLWPSNYHLTFSRSENVSLDRCVEIIDSGTNVAVVFDVPMGEALPETFMGRPVIDGRTHDLRFLDPVGCWVGLSALGKAQNDTSGFVVRIRNAA